jgi:PAS domain S-box-containing protein
VALLRATDGAPLLLHPLPRAPLPDGSSPLPHLLDQAPALPAPGLSPGPEGRFEAEGRSGARQPVAWRFGGEGVPFIAAAALPRDRVLAPFRVRLLRNALMSGVAAMVLGGLGWMVAAALHRGVGAREAAEAGRRELAAVLQATGEAVIALDAGWRITFLNSRAEAAVARGRELRGRTLWAALPGMEGGPFGVAYRRTMELRLPAVVDAPYVPLGRRFRAESHPREDGGIVIFSRDVTDEHEAALRLAESEGRLRAVFAAIDEGYALCEILLDPSGRAADFRFLETNPVFSSMTALGDVSGRTLRETVPGRHDSLIATCARVALDGQPERVEASWRGRRLDIFATAVPPHGRFAVVFRDVTGRRAAEAAVRESEAQLRRVIDSPFILVGVLAPDGTLIEANRGPLEAAGLTIADVRGRLFWECRWWDHDPAMQARAREACERAAAGVSSRFDAVVRMAGASRMRIDFQIAPLRDAQGRITHLVPSAIDVTARRAAEEALAESEARLRLRVPHPPRGHGRDPLDREPRGDCAGGRRPCCGRARREL